MNELLDIFEIEKTCEYRGEIYHVRNNGAIYRSRNLNKRKRPLDEKWTFGNPSSQSGYMNISSETVHRIVATAFHGQPPTIKHVVDHIDTNKRNNRPENLRWLTQIENLLLNHTTLSRLIFSYGSIDNFFNDPSKPLNGRLDSNFDWMRTVSKEESFVGLPRVIIVISTGLVSKLLSPLVMVTTGFKVSVRVSLYSYSDRVVRPESNSISKSVDKPPPAAFHLVILS